MIQYFPIVTGSLTVLGNINVSGSITTSGSITISGSITSASFASTASYWSGSIVNAESASFATSASNATNAISASYANNLTVAGTLTAQTLVVQTITSSVSNITGSTKFGSGSINTHQFTGSVFISGSSTAFAVNNSAFFISSSGNIGIGTTISNAGSSVSGTTVVTIAPQSSVSERWGILELAGNRTSGENQVGEIKFTNINTTNNVVASISGNNTTTGVTGGSLSFSTKTDAGSLTERMRITPSGSVGIGTTSPTYKFEVAGTTGTFSFNPNQASTMVIRGSVTGNFDINNEGASGVMRLYGTSIQLRTAAVDPAVTITAAGEVTFANSISLGTNQRIKTSGGAGNLTGSGQTTISSTIATIFSGFLLGGVQTGNLVIINGVKSGTGWNFTDLVNYMTNGTITVISSSTVNTPPARTYTVSGNDLRLSIAGGDTGFVSCTALTQGYQA